MDGERYVLVILVPLLDSLKVFNLFIITANAEDAPAPKIQRQDVNATIILCKTQADKLRAMKLGVYQ